MPTGYTHIIEERDVTFAEFAKRCLRAMGATIDMRDDPMDAPLRLPEVCDYRTERMAELQQRLAAAQARTPEESAAAARADYEEETRRYTDRLAKYKTSHERYLNMISQVQGWKPPTADHENLKRFMLDQLHMSVDCLYRPTKPEEQSAEEFTAAQIDNLLESLEYDRKYAKDEAHRVAGRRQYILDFLTSIGETL